MGRLLGRGGRRSTLVEREVYQMKMATIAVAAVAVLLGSSVAGAQDTYMLNGSGSWLLDDPTYSGMMFPGFDLVGTFTIEIDDSAWPVEGATDPTRFEHIWDTYFAGNYDATPDAEAWYGTFDGLTMPSTPQFEFNTTTPGGILAGDITIVILIRDWNANGVLDESERYQNQQFAGTLNVNDSLGTGAFTDLCGFGALSTGVFNFVDPPGVDTAQFPGEVSLHPCSAPVESSTWTMIKSLYQ
jgi:hypothetical protein